MNVLFLCQRVPFPPDRGDRITTHHFLRHLRERGCRVRVGCFAETDADRAAASELSGRLRNGVAAPRIDRRWRKLTSLRGVLTGQPLTLPFFRHRGLARTVARWVAQDPPDLIWVYSSGMAQFALPHLDGRVGLMQFAELDSDKWRQFADRGRGPSRWIYRREANRLLAFERDVARAFTISTVVSEVERELFRASIPEVDPLVLPNGVDVDHFGIGDDAARQPHTVVFTGVMDYEPNVDGVRWFAEECWPAVRRALPDARLLVVGSRPVSVVQALHGRDGIEVTGRVPQVPPYLHRAVVAIAPLRLARGVQNKVLEAMSTGLPVVATSAAARGLGDATNAADGLLVADDAEATSHAVVELLADPERARDLGARAAALVRDRFRWSHMFAIADAALAAHGLRFPESSPSPHPAGAGSD